MSPRSEIRNVRLAFGFLTVLPVSPGYTAAMAPARAYFPIVGLAIGGALAALDLTVGHVLPSQVVGTLLIVALLVMSRAIHTEGFLDTCDGLLGGHNRERRLAILRDTHVGAFAVIGAAALLLTKWALLTGTPEAIRVGLLAAFPCIPRCGMLLTMAAFPYARETGAGAAFQAGTSHWQIAFGLATAIAAGGLFLGYAGLVALAVAIVVSLALGRWFTGLLGGMTGDTYGAVNEVGEVATLLIGISLYSRMPALFEAPLW